jgi:hypothetical protein
MLDQEDDNVHATHETSHMQWSQSRLKSRQKITIRIWKRKEKIPKKIPNLFLFFVFCISYFEFMYWKTSNFSSKQSTLVLERLVLERLVLECLVLECLVLKRLVLERIWSNHLDIFVATTSCCTDN